MQLAINQDHSVNLAVPIQQYLDSLIRTYENLDRFWRQQSESWDNSLYNKLMMMSCQIQQVRLSIEKGEKWYIPF